MTTVHAPLKVALLGAGSVGSQVARILLEDADRLIERVGAPLELAGVLVRDLHTERDYEIPAHLCTTQAEELVDGADIVIELLGGIEPARELILRALRGGASVVTGNKALLAQHGSELFQVAAQTGNQLSFEASVAGAIPILRPLRDSLAGDRVSRVLGIANGTTNFILDQMESTGASFEDALDQAQRLGYAEADPTADVEGHDAAAKAAILAGLAFQAPFTLDQVHCEGITGITAADNEAAAAAGYVIKLLAIAERVEDADGPGAVLRVHPTLLPREHPLASVRGAFNAIYVEAQNAGELMFYGPGAGGAPTASAVMGDVVAIAQRLVAGGPWRAQPAQRQLPALPVGRAHTSYLVVLQVTDGPGVLAGIAEVFARRGISIATMHQVSLPEARRSAAAQVPDVSLRIITHRALDADLAQTVEALESLEVVTAVTSVLRVEGD